MKIRMSTTELAELVDIVEENQLTTWSLVYAGGSGIGYTLDVVYDTIINERQASVTINITGPEDW